MIPVDLLKDMAERILASFLQPSGSIESMKEEKKLRLKLEEFERPPKKLKQDTAEELKGQP